MAADRVFSEMEDAFFAEGDALADLTPEPVEDFRDLEPEDPGESGSWLRRVLAALSLLPGRR